MSRNDRAQFSRREFAKLALAGVPAAAVFGRAASLVAQGKPNSVFGGVRIGVIAPYSFNVETPDVASILTTVTKLGISEVELQNNVVEAFAGAPAAPARGGGGGGGRGTPPTPEQLAAQKTYAGQLKAWRVSVPMTKFQELRTQYNNAGVRIHAYRITLTPEMSDAEFDYAFKAAQAIGADQMTMELPSTSEDRQTINLPLTKRIADFGAKYKISAGYHQHLQATPTLWDGALAQSPWNKAQIDIGHFTAAKMGGPAAVIAAIQKHHAQIASLHLKDRRTGEGPNVPWGQGNTPIREVLQLMKKQKYTFPAFIELEYPVPEGSTRVAEVAKCVQYAKDALA
jgi:sugar phosphate isomerase/epimerase